MKSFTQDVGPHVSRAVNQVLYVLRSKVELFFVFLEDLGNQPRIARISRIEERGLRRISS